MTEILIGDSFVFVVNTYIESMVIDGEICESGPIVARDAYVAAQ